MRNIKKQITRNEFVMTLIIVFSLWSVFLFISQSYADQENYFFNLFQEGNALGSTDEPILPLLTNQNLTELENIHSCENDGGICNLTCDLEIQESHIKGNCPEPFLVCCKRKKFCTGSHGLIGICEDKLCNPRGSVIGICEKDNKLCCGIGEYRSGKFNFSQPLIQSNKIAEMIQDNSTVETNNKRESSNPLFYQLVYSEMFTFLAGTASILGLIISLSYPVQIKNIRPSEYRSLRWGKILMMSFGISIMGSSFAQFFIDIDGVKFMETWAKETRELNSENGEPAAVLIFLLALVLTLLKQKLFSWIVLFIMGWIILRKGIRLEPLKTIILRLKDTKDTFEKERDNQLQEILKHRDYENLSTHEKNLYNLKLEYFSIVQNQINKLLTGDDGLVEKMIHLNREAKI